jgi:hypothetical protein
MKRRYSITVSGRTKWPKDLMTGSVMCAPLDAARNYAGLWMPGYKVKAIRYSCVKVTKADGCHSLFVATAWNESTKDERILYVREIEAE